MSDVVFNPNGKFSATIILDNGFTTTGNSTIDGSLTIDGVANILDTLFADAGLGVTGNISVDGVLNFVTDVDDRIYFTENNADGSKIAHKAGNELEISAGTSSSDTGLITFKTGTLGGFVERARLTQNGNLGIGISPTQRLHVSGNTEITNGTLTMRNPTQTAGQRNDFYLRHSSEDNSIFTLIRSELTATNISRLQFYLANVTVNSLIAELTVNGLSVIGNITSTSSMRAVKALIGGYVSGDWAIFKHFDVDTATGYALRQQNDGATILNAADEKTIEFRQNNITRMSLTSNGNLNVVGDADVGGDLNVDGNAIINGTLNARTVSVLGNADTINYYGMTTSSNLLLFQIPSSSQQFFWQAGGNVVMTLSGVGNLTLDGNVRAGTNCYIGNYNSGNFACFRNASTASVQSDYALLQDTTGRTILNCSSGQTLEFRQNNSTLMSITSSGNVNIVNDVDVDGNLNVDGQITGASNLMRFPSDTTGTINRTQISSGTNTDRFIRFRSGGGSPTGIAGVQFSHFDSPNIYMFASGLGLEIYQNTTNSSTKGQFGDRLVVLSPSGNFGVGVSAPTERLHVDGNAIFTGYLSVNAVKQQFDNRTLAPDDIDATEFRFGFGSYNNNNATPWADVLHLNSFNNSTGGGTNALMIKKNGLGIRQYQGTYNSANNYSNYADAMMCDYAEPRSKLLTGTQILPGNNSVQQYAFSHNLGDKWENATSLSGMYRYATSGPWRPMPYFNGVTTVALMQI